MSAGHVDVQGGQGLVVQADGAGEDPELVRRARGLLAVPGGFRLELLGDERELMVLGGGRDAANVLRLPLQILDLEGVSDPLRTLGLTHRGAHLGQRVGRLALVANLGHLLVFGSREGTKMKSQKKSF